MTATQPSTAGVVPPALMLLMRRCLADVATHRGGTLAPGADYLFCSAMRGTLAELGCLPDLGADPSQIAASLMWRTQTVLHWLGELAAGREIPATGWDGLREHGRRLREVAAQVDHLVSLYDEGKDA